MKLVQYVMFTLYERQFAIVAKMESEEQQRRKIILCTSLENPDLSHRAFARTLEIVYSTVSRVLNWYNERSTVNWKEKSGQNASPYSEKDHKRVVQAFKRYPEA